MLSQLTPMGMAISWRQMPGLRVDYFERKDNTRVLGKMPSTMERRRSSPNVISPLSNQMSSPRFFQVGLDAAHKLFDAVVTIAEEDPHPYEGVGFRQLPVRGTNPERAKLGGFGIALWAFHGFESSMTEAILP